MYVPIIVSRGITTVLCGKYIHDTRHDLIIYLPLLVICADAREVGIHAVHHRRDIVVVVVGRLTLTLTLTLGYKIIIEMSPLR